MRAANPAFARAKVNPGRAASVTMTIWRRRGAAAPAKPAIALVPVFAQIAA